MWSVPFGFASFEYYVKICQKIVLLLKKKYIVKVRGVVKILFGLLLSASILFMPRQHSSRESQKDENFVSCCKIQEFVDNCCNNSSHENKKCEGDCLVNCCCFEVELKNEKHLNFGMVVFQNPTKNIDIYGTTYKYFFHNTIYKPPINFIS